MLLAADVPREEDPGIRGGGGGKAVDDEDEG
jgi:hypothetical protein